MRALNRKQRNSSNRLNNKKPRSEPLVSRLSRLQRKPSNNVRLKPPSKLNSKKLRNRLSNRSNSKSNNVERKLIAPSRTLLNLTPSKRRKEHRRPRTRIRTDHMTSADPEPNEEDRTRTTCLRYEIVTSVKTQAASSNAN